MMDNEITLKLTVLNIVADMDLPEGTEPHDMALWMYDWVMDSMPQEQDNVQHLKPVT